MIPPVLFGRPAPRALTLVDFVPVRFPLRPHLCIPITPWVQFHPTSILESAANGWDSCPSATAPYTLQRWLNQTAAHTRKIQVP